jgi:signal recognition particle GTPase
LETVAKKTDERLRLLEAAVFKADRKSTLFEEFEERLIQMDVHMKAEQGRFNELSNQKFHQVEDQLFSYTNKIAECTILKGQFEVF